MFSAARREWSNNSDDDIDDNGKGNLYRSGDA